MARWQLIANRMALAKWPWSGRRPWTERPSAFGRRALFSLSSELLLQQAVSRSNPPQGGFQLQVAKHGRKRKLLIDGFAASPPEPLIVSEFQTHRRTRLDEARAPSCLDLANPWRSGGGLEIVSIRLAEILN